MLAPDGRCKTLDMSADGYVRAENCVAVLMCAANNHLPALGQSDSPYPLTIAIFGSAVNQDGRSSSLTAPNGPAQQAVINAALLAGGTPASSVNLLEMHGTGTSLGDPIEVGAAMTALQVTDFARGAGTIQCNCGEDMKLMTLVHLAAWACRGLAATKVWHSPL